MTQLEQAATTRASIRLSNVATLLIVMTVVLVGCITVFTISYQSRTAHILELANTQAAIWRRVEKVLSVDVISASNQGYQNRNFSDQRRRLADLLEGLEDNQEQLFTALAAPNLHFQNLLFRGEPYLPPAKREPLRNIVKGLIALNASVDQTRTIGDLLTDTNFGVIFQSRRHLAPLEEVIDRLSTDSKRLASLSQGVSFILSALLIVVVVMSRRKFIVPAIERIALAFEQQAADQKRLNHQSDLIAGAFLAIQDAAVVFDSEGELVVANASFKDLMTATNASQPLGLFFSLMQGKPPFNPNQTAWEKLQEVRKNLDAKPTVLIDGKILSWSCTETDSGDLIFVARDQTEITEQFEADKHVARLEALGRVASGVAHDFNNILAGITMRTELLLQEVDMPAQLVDQLNGFLQSSARAKKVTSRLMTYARKETKWAEIIEVKSALEIVEQEIVVPENITLVFDCRSTSKLKINPQEFVTALENAVSNSVYAIDKAEGRICVSAWDHPGPSGQTRVHIAIDDTGVGFTNEALVEAPGLFYTTKKPGEGTGLGLSMIGKMMKALGGELKLSNTAEGARVELIFERETSRATNNVTIMSKKKPRALPKQQHKNACLVLEDDPILAQLIERYLSHFFSSVTLCQTVEEAMEAMVAPASYAAGIFDWNLPDGTSENALIQFKSRFPDAVGFVTTGNPNEELERIMTPLDVQILEKPVTLERFQSIFTVPAAEPQVV